MASSFPRIAVPRMWLLSAVAVLLVVFALELSLSARTESQTFDEPAHMYAGYSYWLRSDFGINPEHPPLVKLVATLPLLVSRPKYPEPVPIHFRAQSGFGGMQMMNEPGADAMLAHVRTAVSTFAFVLALLVFSRSARNVRRRRGAPGACAFRLRSADSGPQPLARNRHGRHLLHLRSDLRVLPLRQAAHVAAPRRLLPRHGPCIRIKALGHSCFLHDLSARRVRAVLRARKIRIGKIPISNPTIQPAPSALIQKPRSPHGRRVYRSSSSLPS